MSKSGDGGLWNDPTKRAWVFQGLAVLALVGGAAYLINNSIENLARQSIATGYGFLDREAGFDIGESLIEYNAASTYGRAFLVGLLNTFEVAILGIILSTILGTLLGIARLSQNWLLATLSRVYVETIRNIPLLLQLLFLYSLINVAAPPPREAWALFPGAFLSNRGLNLPVPEADPSHLWIGIALLIGLIGAGVMDHWARRRQEATGQPFPTLAAGLGIIVGIPFLVFLGFGAPHEVSFPELHGFNFSGGMSVSPELAAILGGLVIYTSSYIAEIVRGGILAVSWGQTEAAGALGLRRSQVLRLIVLPQALRMIIPPLTSQYLNLTKNSTLAVAIGFPDLVFVANTTINQTGQAIEGMSIIMGTYLLISLSISFAMNVYNARIALKGR
jgi:general L-amino acid transport system permease protein